MLTDKQFEQIKNAAIKAHREGRPLFKPKPNPTPATPQAEFSEEAIFAQMKKLGGTIR